MSEYETTDLGGDPVEFEFVEGGTYERGVIRSTADHQQIRRDAEQLVGNTIRWSANEDANLAVQVARHCLALLAENQDWRIAAGKAQQDVVSLRAELEQAEQERDRALERLWDKQ